MFLGHVICKDGIFAVPKKVDVVVNWSRPMNMHKIRSLLGLVGYHRRFIMGFSRIVKPLTKLT